MSSKPSKSKKDPGVDKLLAKSAQWRQELEKLRSIALASGLEEDIKWGQPTYTFDDRNVAILGDFKDYCSLSFFKGVLLEDPENILDKPGENTRSGRLVRFTSVEEIEKLEPVLAAYLKEAIEVEKAGLEVDFEKDREVPLPEELKQLLESDASFHQAWKDLTPGRQRGYLLHFSSAKQSKTVTARIEKYRQAILEGKGMHDE